MGRVTATLADGQALSYLSGRLELDRIRNEVVTEWMGEA